MPIAARLIAAAALALPAAIAIADDVDAGIARVMAAHVKPGEPGCTVGVAEGGKLTRALAFGLSDLERGKPLDAHSVFNLASVSKQFTAFAILLLEQDGKLKVDDPVVKYLPELAQSAKGVTLAQLMHHTGGLRDYIEVIYMGGRVDADGTTIDETVRLLARQTAPNEAPGVEFDYSNTGYFLLGVVVARVSGQSLAEFSRQRIFVPLGMKNTSIIDRYPAPIPALARGYARAETGFRIDETGWEQVGDGQVHSDLQDLALWDENFYTGQVGGKALVAKMLDVGLLNSGESTGYAAGVNVSESRGFRWVTHSGSWVGYKSALQRLPDEHLSVIVLCNRAEADASAYAEEVFALLLGDRLGPPEPEEEEPEAEPVAAQWDPGELARFAGAYYSPEAGVRCVLDQRGARLVLEGCARGAVLKPGKPGELVTPDGSPVLRFADGGRDTGGFIYWSPGLRGLPFKRIEEKFE
ncbi:MAG: beta-lactamase family protein [Gammaproteobacteria bacterium]|nr:beta-lactamase family protein [Gammaproteobacteria bacterium]